MAPWIWLHPPPLSHHLILAILYLPHLSKLQILSLRLRDRCDDFSFLVTISANISEHFCETFASTVRWRIPLCMWDYVKNYREEIPLQGQGRPPGIWATMWWLSKMLSSPWQRQTDRQTCRGTAARQSEQLEGFAQKESNRDTHRTYRLCIVKGLGHEKDFQKFNRNGQI